LPKKRRLRAVSRHYGSPRSQKADLGGPERTSRGTITNYIIFINASLVGRSQLLARSKAKPLLYESDFPSFTRHGL
jgi:hypothetical protein